MAKKSGMDLADTIGIGMVMFAVYLGVQNNNALQSSVSNIGAAMGAAAGAAGGGGERPGTSCLSREQLRNAKIIIAEGRRAGVSRRGQQIAIAAAMQESTMRALPYGDRDSLGIFQQRAAWGSRAARMDPHRSARLFYKGSPFGHPGLLDKSAWQLQSISDAAQSVQQSAYPDRYAKWSSLARRVVANPNRTACK